MSALLVVKVLLALGALVALVRGVLRLAAAQRRRARRLRVIDGGKAPRESERLTPKERQALTRAVQPPERKGRIR